MATNTTYRNGDVLSAKVKKVGWFLANIICPILIPIFGLLLLRFIPLSKHPTASPSDSLAEKKRASTTVDLFINPMILLKDGQLGWVAMTMGIAALYEYSEANDIWIGANKHLPAWSVLLQILLIVSISVSLLVASLGSIYSTPELRRKVTLREWLTHYRCFVFSALWAATAGIAFAIVHLYLLPAATQWRI